jgi:excisionase family DNA binding protein
VSGAAVLSARNLAREYLAPSEAARRLGLSRERVHQLIEEGRLSAVRTPLGRIVPAADVEAEVRRRRALSPGEESESGGADG